MSERQDDRPLVRPGRPRETVQARFSDGTVYEGPLGTRLEHFVEAACQHEKVPNMAAIVDGRLRELTYPLKNDADVLPLSMVSSDGLRIYQRSLSFILVVAANELFPEAGIVVDHSLTRGGFFCEVTGRPPFSQEELAQIEARMREIVAADEPIRRKEVPIPEAMRLLEAQKCSGKARLLLTQAEREYLTIYALRGNYDYFYGYMVPSTRYVHLFGLRPHNEGFILAFPTRARPAALPTYRQHSKLTSVFRQHRDWMKVMDIDHVADLNEAISGRRIREVVLVSEALQEKRLAEIAAKIAAREDTLKLVLIAGPSSSGKTTFIKRLAVQLLALGIHPVSVGLDDYFVDREVTPRDDEGNYDFEALEAVDLSLFNEHLEQLFAGKRVQLPAFNFQTGRREAGRELLLSPGDMLMVEGIHGLNPRLIQDIPADQTYRIYVSALTQLNIDCHNRVPTTDTRLIRRIVRDAQFRGYSALKTIRRWESVLRGERRKIFPYQDNADEMFNSALLYELAVLKPFVEPLLRQIEQDTIMEHIEAHRLLSFLGWFWPCSAELVPDNSLLREFIGGSSLAEFSY